MAIKKQRAIISLGGSLMVPDAIDIHFIQDIVARIRALSERYAFVLFCGGGRTARNYQAALKACVDASPDACDWVGIQSSILNATLLSHVFGTDADTHIITDPRVRLSWKKSIYIGAGWKPGRSTDYDAVRLAIENDITLVINLSNVEYVYSADPRNTPSAQRFTQISWKDMRTIVGDDWSPGMNVPFDPVAAKLAQENDVTVRFLHGKYINDLEKALISTDFHGTDISNDHPNLL